MEHICRGAIVDFKQVYIPHHRALMLREFKKGRLLRGASHEGAPAFPGVSPLLNFAFDNTSLKKRAPRKVPSVALQSTGTGQKEACPKFKRPRVTHYTRSSPTKVVTRSELRRIC